MKRWAVGIALVLAAACGGLYWLYTSLDFVVKTAIERFAPDMLGASVRVREVRISTADGRGALRGIEIGNPPGYSSPRSLRAGSIAVGVEPATIGSDLVVIREIVVDAPEITYEVKDGTNNLEAMRRNVEAYLRRTGGEPARRGEGAGQPPGRRYVIGRIAMRGARVTMTHPHLAGGGLTLDLPDLDLRDIGKRSGGVTAAEAAAIVINAILSNVARTVLTNLDALRRGGWEGALDALRGLETLRGLLR